MSTAKPQQAPEGAIVASGLARTYAGNLLAVDGVDLHVDEGEIYGFLGPNGAGKSTTVRILTTLLRPTSGSAWVAGHDVVSQSSAVRRSIGVALQEAALDPLMSGTELLRLQGALHGLRRAEARARATELLERVDLVEAADRRLGTYSGGMRRRLDLALALVHRPQVLFLDEPTTGLDPASRAALWREVRALNDDGTTVFLTTQYLEEAEQLADRVGIIDRGRIVAEGTPDELKAHVGEPSLHIELVDPGRVEDARAALAEHGVCDEDRGGGLVLRAAIGARAIAPVVRTLGDHGIEIDAVEVQSPTLDDVFLAVTGHTATQSELGEQQAEAAEAAALSASGAEAEATASTPAALERDAAVQMRVVAALSARAIRVQFRRAQFLIPAFMLPLVLLAVVASGTSAARDLPTFPDTGAYVGFVVGGTLMQGALLAGLTAGIALAADIETGFFDRLLTAPLQRVTIVLGRVVAASVLGVLQGIFFLSVAFAFGARYTGGPGGVLLAVVLGALTAGTLAGLAAAIALRTGSLSLLQNLFPLTFVLLFTAPAFFPRELLNPVAESIAAYNPLAYVVEGIRGALFGSKLGDPWLGLAVAVAAILTTTALAELAMRRRLATQ